MLHWPTNGNRMLVVVCGKRGLLKKATRPEAVTCPACRATLDLGTGPADGPTLAERLASAHRAAK
jgi:hypothetical protein